VAIKVFADNLRDLLLAAPAGPRVVMGLDPGIRTGVKVAVVDATGKLLDTATVYPHEPRKDWDGSLHTLARCAPKARREPDRHRQRHRQPRDRQAGRRPDQALPRPDKKTSCRRSWSAKPAPRSIRPANSPAKELPDLDVSLRGAVSASRAACRTRWPSW
jgi:uncharacterized protein